MLLTLGMVCLFILHIAYRPNGHSMLFDQDSTYGRRWGSLYNTYREGSLAFVGIFLIVMLARSVITGFGQGHGLAQMCALLAVDLIVCISESFETCLERRTQHFFYRFGHLATILQPWLQSRQLHA
jgi:hypothetical protein